MSLPIAPPAAPAAAPSLDVPAASVRPSTEPAAGSVRWPLVRALLGVPLFYKILLANAFIVVVGAIAGSAITAEWVRSSPRRSVAELVGILAVVGVAMVVLVNALILRLALRPLATLERTAARVQTGDLDARAPSSLLADRELERLTHTFNGMLDSVARYRRRLRETAARALGAQEEERKRIARELHDDTAQTLAALLIRIRLARAATDAATRDQLWEEVRREISSALEGIRRFARGLRPPALDELGLLPAIESHVRGLSEATGLAIRIVEHPSASCLRNEVPGEAGLLTPEAELALYRIVQEALSNVVRHAEAHEASVELRCTGAVVTAEIRDDGHGFRPDRLRENEGQGLGLFGMRERAAYVGGRVEVSSRVGAGTRVRAEIPFATTREP